MFPQRSAAIIGAGIGGLTAALFLQRAGWRVKVYEQSAALGEVGAGLTLSSGAAKALALAGLGPALIAASLPVPDIAFVHYRTGALLAGVLNRGLPPERGLDTPRHIHRADLHAILTAAVQGIDPEALETGKRLVAVDQPGAGATARFADASTASADLLIGADGVRSEVRRLLFADAPPEFAGQVAFRCLVPAADAAPFMAGGNAVVSIGAGRIFNRYVIRGGAVVNVVGIAKTVQWPNEGWSTRATVGEFLRAFDGFNEDVLGLIKTAPLENLIKWGLFVRPPLTRWSAGRVVLLGDAAHPILPFLGLGAALAIEDGVVLSRALDLFEDVPAAFEAFQQARVARVETVRRQSIRQGEIIQSSNVDGGAVARSPSQDVDLFDYDPLQAPIQR